MLKFDPEFRIYDYSHYKAAKSLIKAGIIGREWLKEEYKELDASGLDATALRRNILSYVPVTAVGLKQYRTVAKTNAMHEMLYAVQDEDVPMTFEEIYKVYNQAYYYFVAICHKNAEGKLELTGFVY